MEMALCVVAHVEFKQFASNSPGLLPTNLLEIFVSVSELQSGKSVLGLKVNNFWVLEIPSMDSSEGLNLKLASVTESPNGCYRLILFNAAPDESAVPIKAGVHQLGFGVSERRSRMDFFRGQTLLRFVKS